MRPEMLFTINEYDPNKPDHPITSAWDDTQSKVLTENTDINSFETNIHSKFFCNFRIFSVKVLWFEIKKRRTRKTMGSMA